MERRSEVLVSVVHVRILHILDDTGALEQVKVRCPFGVILPANRASVRVRGRVEGRRDLLLEYVAIDLYRHVLLHDLRRGLVVLFGVNIALGGRTQQFVYGLRICLGKSGIDPE
jgi:hypothetical protein